MEDAAISRLWHTEHDATMEYVTTRKVPAGNGVSVGPRR
jgi:hypothetical protein